MGLVSGFLSIDLIQEIEEVKMVDFLDGTGCGLLWSNNAALATLRFAVI